MNRTLKNTLTIPVILAFMVLGVLAFFLVSRQIHDRLLAEFDQTLAAKTSLLTSLTAFEEADLEEDEPEPFVELDFEADFMPEFSDESEGSYFQIWIDGEEFARSDSLHETQLPNPALVEGQARLDDLTLPDGREGRMLSRRFRPYLDEEWGESPDVRVANVAARYPDLSYPWMTITVAVSREALDETLLFINTVLGVALIVLMLAVSGLVRFFTVRGLRPLNRMVGQLDDINAERLDTRLDDRQLPGEVQPIATTMNALLDRLQLSFDRERQFSRNVAHELKTPIAELRSIGEVGERWPDDPETNQRFFQDVLQIGNRMDLMVTNLLTIARQESGQITCALEALDLTSAISGIRHRFRIECRQLGVDVQMEQTHPIDVQADRVYLDIIASNLLANAVQHGNGTVEVNVYSNDSSAGFEVENPAGELTEDDLQCIFDRFWRKDTARSNGRHAGLGLALARSLAEVCDWSLRAELTPDRMFRIRVDGIRRA